MKIIAKKGSDTITIDVLDDGTFKITTDKISMANHGNAEIILHELIKGAGGEVKRIKKGHTHDHHHGDHIHE